MDKRFYFVFGDLLSNVLVGAIVAWVSWLIVSPDWNMFVAMWAMMFVGMAISLPLFIPASMLFGAMEIMLPTMFTGMLSGMVVGMWIPMSPLSALQAVAIGAAVGVLGIVIIWVMNARLRGVQELPKQKH